MNIILFAPEEVGGLLRLTDPRARHVLSVLRRGPGDSFDAGLVDGPRGKATVVAMDEASLYLEFAWGEEPPPLDPITLIVGLPRPQTCRKVLEEATALGVQTMHFVTAQRGQPGYARSKLWSTEEWRRHVMDGAAQAFTTRLPDVTAGRPLQDVVDHLPPGACRLALDNYEASGPLSQASMAAPVVLALGPERGWSAAERNFLRAAGFELVHLGERVLRVETACVAAVTLLKARLGYF
jgi:RsmE family RNA methyltransferase